ERPRRRAPDLRRHRRRRPLCYPEGFRRPTVRHRRDRATLARPPAVQRGRRGEPATCAATRAASPTRAGRRTAYARAPAARTCTAVPRRGRRPWRRKERTVTDTTVTWLTQ